MVIFHVYTQACTSVCVITSQHMHTQQPSTAAPDAVTSVPLAIATNSPSSDKATQEPMDIGVGNGGVHTDEQRVDRKNITVMTSATGSRVMESMNDKENRGGDVPSTAEPMELGGDGAGDGTGDGARDRVGDGTRDGTGDGTGDGAGTAPQHPQQHKASNRPDQVMCVDSMGHQVGVEYAQQQGGMSRDPMDALDEEPPPQKPVKRVKSEAAMLRHAPVMLSELPFEEAVDVMVEFLKTDRYVGVGVCVGIEHG